MLIRLLGARALALLKIMQLDIKQIEIQIVCVFSLSSSPFRRTSKCHQTKCRVAIVRPGAVHSTISNGRHRCGWFAVVRWWHLRTRHMRRRFGQFANEDCIERMGRRWNRVVRTGMRSARLASRLYESLSLRSMDSQPFEAMKVEFT